MSTLKKGDIMKRKANVTASRAVDTKLEAARILEQLKAVYDLIESSSNETYVKYVPFGLLEDLDVAIREMSMDLGD